MEVTFKFNIGENVTVMAHNLDGVVIYCGCGDRSGSRCRYQVEYLASGKVETEWFDEEDLAART